MQLDTYLTKVGFKPSNYQRNVFEKVIENKRNLFVGATAGSGKTSTLIHALAIARQINPKARICFLAFNKKIANEIENKTQGINVEVKTFHSLGFSMLRGSGRKFGGKGVFFRVNDKPNFRLFDFFNSHPSTRLFKGMAGQEARMANDIRSEVMGAIGLAKNLLFDFTNPNTVAEVCALYDKPVTQESVSLLSKAMAEDAMLSQRGNITFDDMLYLPVIWQIEAREKYDIVLIDEAQDMNNVQEKILSLITHKESRLIAVGDTAQAIYGFRGSNIDAVNQLVQTFNMETLPLSICYRCPSSHIELAQTYCEQIEARENAPVGELERLSVEQFENKVIEGDLVVARCNAPLIMHALNCIARGKKAIVLGNDIGKDLIALVQRFETDIVAEVLEKLEVWHREAVDKAMLRQQSTQTIDDKYACVQILLEGCQSIEQYVAKVTSLFDEERKGITFSTIHKAKGVENHSVFFLEDGFTMSDGKAWQKEQLKNLRFVATTRSTNYLGIVDIAKKKNDKKAVA